MFVQTLRIFPNLLRRLGGITIDHKGTIYVTDSTLHQIFQIERTKDVSYKSSDKNDRDIFDSIHSSFDDLTHNNNVNFHSAKGVVYSCTLIAGSSNGFQDGIGLNAQFKSPYGIVVDDKGILYIADRENHRIRQVVFKDGVAIVSTLTGTGTEGWKDGSFDTAQFSWPFQMTLRNNELYVTEIGTHTIRKINLQTRTVSTIAGSGKAGFINGVYPKSVLSYPHGVAVDNHGIVYVCDFYNNCIRRIENGQVTILTGQVDKHGYRDGSLQEAEFACPDGLALDYDGNLIVGDKENNRIRKIDLRKGTVTTMAGNGFDKLHDGQPLLASFRTKSSPFMIAAAPDDSILIVDNDYDTAVIRRLCIAGMPWNVERLLWIGQMKCKAQETPIAVLPTEMIQHIIRHYRQTKFLENPTTNNSPKKSGKRKRDSTDGEPDGKQ